MSNAPPRLVALQGATNFRDLGGYAGEGGRRVRWRRLFRSDHLGGLTPEDHATLAALGVRRSFDFRGVAERAAVPYTVDGLRQHTLAIEPTVVEQLQSLVRSGRTLDAALASAVMQDLYRHLVNERADTYATFLGHLVDDDTPAVFHCTAGKDRTGVAAALLLLALGVARDEVEHDFLLTNQHFKAPPQPRSEIPPDAVAVLWSVQAGFLHAALDAIEEQHGGLDRYLERRLGLTPAARRTLVARYLEG